MQNSSETGCEYHQFRFILADSDAPAARDTAFRPETPKISILVKYAKIQIFRKPSVFLCFGVEN